MFKIENKIKIVGILGALAVALGAFGAHGLKSIIDTPSLQSYQTGVLYHFIHTGALALTILLSKEAVSKNLNRAFILFFLGIILFSGSLYGMAFGKAAGLDLSFLGPITPLGGLTFIVSWLFLAFSAKPENL
jgi:uncharacterized membrane protein YgdD (TMEM256/DUF423 family)